MDIRVRSIATAGLLALMMSLPGCATWFTGNYQDPEVHLIKVEVVKARLLQQQFVLRFRIDNPNDSSLPIRGITYRIHLNDLLLVDGEASDWFTVAAQSREYYDIPVRTNLWQHLREIAKMLEHTDRPIRYNLEGELRTGVLFGHDVPLRRSAEIIPGALLQN